MPAAPIMSTVRIRYTEKDARTCSVRIKIGTTAVEAIADFHKDSLSSLTFKFLLSK